jgi:uncharacterized damage-inducible protein DinB
VYCFGAPEPEPAEGQAGESYTAAVDSPSEFLIYFEKIRGRTERVAALIPEDRVEWSPAPGKWTLGDTVRHIAAMERWMFAENAMRRPSRYAGCGPELADGRDAVLAYLRDRHRESVAIFGSLSESDFESRCETPGGAPIRIGKWLRSMIEHEIHHRGQIYLMLALLGIETPPLYGLTSEEVRARSVS